MIPVYLLVVALADWDLILGEPIVRMLQAMIDVSNQVMTIQPDLTDRPITLSGIIDKTPRRDAVSAALVTVAATDVIVEDQQQSKISEIDNDEINIETTKSDDALTSPVKPYSYDEGVARLGYDYIKEFDDVFLLKKPTALPPFRQINHKIDIIDDAAYKVMQPRRFKPTEAFLDQLRDKIDAEQLTGRVYPAQDSSACSIFMVKKFDKPKIGRAHV